MPRVSAANVIKGIGRRIAETREAAGRTQDDVAAALGIATRNYQQVERGKQNLTIATLVRLANELGVKPIELWEPPTTPRRKRGRPKRRPVEG